MRNRTPSYAVQVHRAPVITIGPKKYSTGTSMHPLYSARVTKVMRTPPPRPRHESDP